MSGRQLKRGGMRFLVFAVCFLVFLIISSLPCQASWLSSTYGVGTPYDLAVDQSGNVYVVGNAPNAPQMGYDYLIIKYNSVGDTVWTRQFDGGSGAEYAYAVTIDPAGNILATGSGTVKYTPSGDLLWYKAQADGIDVTTDANGNVYVVTSNYTLKKYSANGDSIWVNNQWYSDPSQAIAVKLDGNGNIYVGGSRFAGGDYGLDFFVVKYSPAGNYLWYRFVGNGPGPYSDNHAYGFALDPQGNSYISGPFYGYLTIKYGPNGETLWSNTYPQASLGPWYNTITLDKFGNVYMAGYYGYRGPLQEIKTDYVIVKYSPTGENMWVRRINLATGNPDGVGIPNLTTDEAGNLYLASTDLNNMAAFKFDAGGMLRWARFYDTNPNTTNHLYAAAAKNGDLYLTGISDYVYLTTLQYTCNGTLSAPGDANADNQVSLADLISAVNFIFGKSNWPPCPSNTNLCWLSDVLCRGDWNADGNVTLGDVIRGVNYLFSKPGGSWNPVSPTNCCLPVS